MEYRVIIAGFGGQGVLFAGKVIANAAALMGYEVSWLPSYGPEMRGGTANCRVVISDCSICSPAVERADALIALNLPSFEKFRAAAETVIVTDRRFPMPSRSAARIVGIDSGSCVGGAEHEGLLNMVMVGALAADALPVSVSAAEAAIEKLARGAAAARDIAALRHGAALAAGLF